MRRHDTRMARVQKAIDDSPVRRKVLREAYDWFWMFGEMPDDDHVAYEVVQQALNGGEERPMIAEEQLEPRVKQARAAYWKRGHLPLRTTPQTVRDRLFEEALFEQGQLRHAARSAIAIEVAYDGDVESPGFASRHGMPFHGSAGMHVLGYPGKWATPPYEFQAQRLFTRLDVLRFRIAADDRAWFEVQVDAVVHFLQTGELPEDALRAEVLLAEVELEQLVAHKRGKDVSEAMALFDLAARREGEERDEVLDQICALAAAGRLA
jgi:hypothetical protein